jgi:hypothetical protein
MLSRELLEKIRRSAAGRHCFCCAHGANDSGWNRF